MNYPMKGRPSVHEINSNIQAASLKVGNRPTDKASFEYGYWQGVHDERVRHLKELDQELRHAEKM